MSQNVSPAPEESLVKNHAPTEMTNKQDGSSVSAKVIKAPLDPKLITDTQGRF